jgi:hypothetical protein
VTGGAARFGWLSVRPVLVFGVVAGAVAVAFLWLVRPASGDDRLCVNVASAVGLNVRGAYGTTVAPGPMGAMMQRNMGQGAAVGDYDADGDLDVYVVTANGHPNRLLRNELRPSGVARFTDVTEPSGVGDTGLGRVAHFADLDGDRRLDLIVLNDRHPDGRLSPSRLYRNAGDGTFSDVSEGSGFDPVGFIVGGVSLADPDVDGDLDVYVSYWTQELGGDPGLREVRGIYDAENRFYRNDGDFKFTEMARDAGLSGIRRDTFSSIFLDFDGDTDLDLFVAVDHLADLYYEQVGPLLWEDRSVAVGATHTGNDMGVAVADLGSDGSVDLFATNITDPKGEFGTSQGNVLSAVERGPDGSLTFVDRAATSGVVDTAWGWGTSFLDIDLDADLDLFVAQGMDEFVSATSPAVRDATSALFIGDDGSFSRATGTGCDIGGDQRAAVAFDYDRDGDQDILMTQVAFSTVLLENRTPAGRSVTVDLGEGGAAAAGARIAVTTGERVVTQFVLAGGSYLAGPPLEAVFGLGEADSANEVRITWADGRETVVPDVAAGSVIRPVP